MINQPPSLLVLTPDWAAHYREWKHTGRRHINPGLQQNVTIILWHDISTLNNADFYTIDKLIELMLRLKHNTVAIRMSDYLSSSRKQELTINTASKIEWNSVQYTVLLPCRLIRFISILLVCFTDILYNNVINYTHEAAVLQHII